MADLDADALRARREEMFGESIVVSTESFEIRDEADGSIKASGVHARTASPCNECGSLVFGEDAHFGFHCKVDNIDERLVQLARDVRHSH